MYQRVIATMGTSLLANPLGVSWIAGEDAQLAENKKMSRGERMAALDVMEHRWRSALPVVTDDKRVSAEYSVLSALRRSRQLGREPEVVLIHTDTFDGELAARMLRMLLVRDFSASVRLVSVLDMDVGDRARLRASLGGFMHCVASALREGHPSNTVFAPLGGYKVMTSLGVLAGAYCGYSSIYLHEKGQALHTVPWVPIRFDEAVLREAAPLMRRLRGSLVAWAAISVAERVQVEALPWLFDVEEVDGERVVALGAFGEFLAREERVRGLFAPRVMVADEDVLLVRRCAAEVQTHVGHLLEWLPLAETERRGEMHHEVAFGHHGTRYALYKHGASAVRMAWRFDEEVGVLFLRRVWVVHERYEREVASGEVLRSEPKAWVEVMEVAGG